MKKLLVIGIALFVAMVFAMPATATDLKLGGYYFVQGRYQSNPSLDDDADDGGASYRMRFRFTPAFIVSDALRFDMKMDIWDGTRFGTQGPKAATTGAIDWDRLWMTLKFDFGSFALGRMAGGSWGLWWFDDNEDYDRVRFDTKFGNVTTGIIFQKNIEADWGANGEVDRDSDTYYLYGNYKGDIGSIGLLGAYTLNKTVTTQDSTKYNLLPYFDLQFGNFGARGELLWANGEIDPDGAGAATTDIEELAWVLEGDVKFGAFKVTAGYTWVQGDEDITDDKIKETNLTYGGYGDDVDMFVVMGDVDQLVNGHALSAAGADYRGMAGVKLAYALLDWKARKDLSFRVGVGYAEAEETGGLDQFYGTSVDDEYGLEYAFHAKWDIMKNLYLAFHFGYFDAGDMFKTVNGVTNLEDTMTGYWDLRLNF